MPVNEKTRRDRAIDKALDLKRLKLPKSLPLDRPLEWEDYWDWDGEPALRILAVLKESVEVKRISGVDVGDFKDAIHDSLIELGESRFPYIFFAKPSELAEDDEE